MNTEVVVVKVGTNVLQDEDDLNLSVCGHLCSQLAQLMKNNIRIVLVTSGAVGAGKIHLSKSKSHNAIIQQQLFAAVGQVELMSRYRELLHSHQVKVAQVLATKEDFRDRKHYLNMRNCLEGLLAEGVLPIVNENDVISIRELMFTDNDELAGLIAAMLGAQKLILLSSVEGIMSRSPEDPASELIAQVKDITGLEDYAFDVKSPRGRGGMHGKIATVKKAASLGIECVIAAGRMPEVLTRLLLKNEHIGTRIYAQPAPNQLKKWLSSVSIQHTTAAIVVNDGARAALRDPQSASSLLPIGVISYSGTFAKGDIISITDPQEQLLGLGIASYNSATLATYLGKKNSKAIVHYNYLYVL